MYHVMLAIDEDETRAEKLVDTLLEIPEASEHVKATVFHCFTDNPEGASITQFKTARDVSGRLDEAGVEHEMAESSGDPVNEIVEAAEEHDVDVIYLAGRKRSPAGKVLFGSVAQGVALSTNRPVLLCGEQ